MRIQDKMSIKYLKLKICTFLSPIKQNRYLQRNLIYQTLDFTLGAYLNKSK